MPPLSEQRVKLESAIEIASRIAKCEPDPQTVRATIMYCLERNVEGFPVSKIIISRIFAANKFDDHPGQYVQQQPGVHRLHRCRRLAFELSYCSLSWVPPAIALPSHVPDVDFYISFHPFPLVFNVGILQLATCRIPSGQCGKHLCLFSLQSFSLPRQAHDREAAVEFHQRPKGDRLGRCSKISEDWRGSRSDRQECCEEGQAELPRCG